MRDRQQNPLHTGNTGWHNLSRLLREKEVSKIFILTDLNTARFCVPVFEEKMPEPIEYELLQIPDGEENKTIFTCMDVWKNLIDREIDRYSLILNLGGGMVTDLGGFVASTVKRGVPFINIPTTLLAMVDASIGGKNGIDFGNLKNQIGVINPPDLVLIEPDFLKTLPERHLIAGISEMIKHSLLDKPQTWEKIKDFNPGSFRSFTPVIEESIRIKEKIVAADPYEENIRKSLNFGHTLGHAVESHCIENGHPLLHGEAVFIGLILELYISHRKFNFPFDLLKEISGKILELFPKQSFSKADIESIKKMAVFDKKNKNGRVLFVLLEDIGKIKTDCIVSNELIDSAFGFYKEF